VKRTDRVLGDCYTTNRGLNVTWKSYGFKQVCLFVRSDHLSAYTTTRSHRCTEKTRCARETRRLRTPAHLPANLSYFTDAFAGRCACARKRLVSYARIVCERLSARSVDYEGLLSTPCTFCHAPRASIFSGVILARKDPIHTADITMLAAN
jgi:hypothetical protein